jgi:hypothetical protein
VIACKQKNAGVLNRELRHFVSANRDEIKIAFPIDRSPVLTKILLTVNVVAGVRTVTN